MRSNRREIFRDLSAGQEQLIAVAARNTEAEAKSSAPVDTGFLRNSIQASRAGVAHWKVAVGALYGLFVEMGTVNQTAKPYLLPAFRRQVAALKTALRRMR